MDDEKFMLLRGRASGEPVFFPTPTTRAVYRFPCLSSGLSQQETALSVLATESQVRAAAAPCWAEEVPE